MTPFVALLVTAIIVVGTPVHASGTKESELILPDGDIAKGPEDIQAFLDG